MELTEADPKSLSQYYKGRSKYIEFHGENKYHQHNEY